MNPEWECFIQTPPTLTKIYDGDKYQYSETESEPTIQPLSPFIPCSPSLPDLLTAQADPTSTLLYLGLYNEHDDSSIGTHPMISEEFENRSVLIYNVEPNTNIGEIKQFLKFYGDLKDIEFVQDGVVKVTFYDLKQALTARRSIPTVIFKGCVLDARYSPPNKIIDPQKPPNNGTIVIFHLPAGFTNNQLSETFGKFGEIRQIRGTPSKPNQRFVEYWDTRSSALALEKMNGKILLGSRISIEYSLPGGYRREVQKKIYDLNLNNTK